MREQTVRDLRRGQIVAAARRIVAEEGLEALTISTLEARLDYTRGVITYHFRDKGDIVQAVLASAVAEIDAAVTAGVLASASLPDRVRAVLHGQVRGWLDHPEASRIVLSFWGRLSSDRAAARANAALYDRYRVSAAQMVAGTHADPETVATLMVGTVIGIVCQELFEPGAIDPEAAVDEAAAMIAARLRRSRS